MRKSKCVVKMSVTNFRNIVKKAMESEWAVAYREKRNGEIITSEKHCFLLIKNTLRYWCADPFLVEEGKRTFVFLEAFDRVKRKGVIAYREISGNKVGKIKIIIEEPFHLSYPYIYSENGNWYIIPESKDLNQVIRYQSKEFPDVWEKEKVLIDDIAAVDTTVLCNRGSNIILLTYLWESFNKGELQMIQSEDHSQSILYKIADPDGRKRPAGRICMIRDVHYRPSQLCTRTYGEAIIFNRILGITENTYAETEYKTVFAGDISLDRTVKIVGVHTYNHSENWETIDVEMVDFSLLRMIGLIPRIYHYIKRKVILR